MNDSELVARSLKRDHLAFAKLFDTHSPVVFRYAFRLTHNSDDAQDLVQEAFVTAWKKLADIRLVGDSMLPWLLVVVRNNAANLRRSKAVRTSIPIEGDGVQDPSPSPLDRLQVHEELQWVLEAVGDLSDLDRRIVELCIYEEQSYQEAARSLGLTVGVVTKRVHRVRSKLRQRRQVREGESPA